MTFRILVASGLVVAAIVTPVLADSGKASVRISTEVVRSCRVTTDQPQVSVNCGTQSQPVQVSYARAPQSDIAPTGHTSAAPSSPTSVTIQF
jgi:hypothetical protein